MRTCCIAGCNAPDVIAPSEGTWPTCSNKMPICREHLLAIRRHAGETPAEAAARARRSDPSEIRFFTA